MHPETDRISAIPLFVQLSPEELGTVASWLEIREESEGRPLTPEGASGYEFFVIEEGTADVVHGGEVIGSLGPGDFFGEMAMMGDGRRVADVVASSPITLFEMFGHISASSRCACRRSPPPSPRSSRSVGRRSEPATPRARAAIIRTIPRTAITIATTTLGRADHRLPVRPVADQLLVRTGEMTRRQTGGPNAAGSEGHRETLGAMARYLPGLSGMRLL